MLVCSEREERQTRSFGEIGASYIDVLSRELPPTFEIHRRLPKEIIRRPLQSQLMQLDSSGNEGDGAASVVVGFYPSPVSPRVLSSCPPRRPRQVAPPVVSVRQNPADRNASWPKTGCEGRRGSGMMLLRRGPSRSAIRRQPALWCAARHTTGPRSKGFGGLSAGPVESQPRREANELVNLTFNAACQGFFFLLLGSEHVCTPPHRICLSAPRRQTEPWKLDTARGWASKGLQSFALDRTRAFPLSSSGGSCRQF